MKQSADMIIVKAEVKASIDKVWSCFNEPEHITKWNFAHESWQCPKAENDLRQAGKFSYRMEAKDGSMGFDFGGTYTLIIPFEKIEYTLDDGRKVEILFKKIDNNTTEVIEIFEPETQHPQDFQQQGWQAILNQFKKYTETL